MLVHMTPGEVHGLQALAMKHGGSLTTNPDTGLPEANFLKSLLPILAGFALGPAGMGIAFGGLSSAASAGLLVGGVTGLATGSLSKGLMAGLGAYGGAGLGGGLSELGAGELAQGQISANMPTLAEGATQAQIADYTQQVNDLRTAGLQGASQLPMADKLSAGFSSASASPMDALNFAKDNKLALGMAAAPIMADMMVPTTTKSAPVQSPGRIVEKRWDGRQFVPVASTDAGVFNTSGRTFSDPYRGYNNGGIVALAEGGDVKHFAIGDLVKADIDKAYAAGDYGAVQKLVEQNQISAADVSNTYKGFDTSGLAGLGINLYNPAAETLYQKTGSWDAAAKARDDAANAANLATWNAQNKTTADANNAANTATWNAQNQATWAAQPIQYTDAQIGKYLTDNPNVDIAKAITETRADPVAVNRYIASLTKPFVGSTDTTGGSGTLGIYNQMVAQGIDANELYNASNAAATANKSTYGGWSAADIAKGYNLDKGAYALAAAEKDGVSDKEWAKFMDDNNYSINDMAQAFGISKNEVKRRYDAAKAVETKVNDLVCGPGFTKSIDGKSCVPIKVVDIFNPPAVPSGFHINSAGVLVPNVDATQNTSTDVTVPTDLYTAPASSLAVGVGGNTGPSQIGGGATVNPNGTITTSPRIPGIPVGGFTGMQNLRDVYTKGGGSLGYTSPKFDKIEDFNAKYVDKRLTGDSKAAYDFLTGKAGAKYPTKSSVDGQIAVPYDEAVLGYPKRGNLPYIYNKTTGKMDPNPDYVAPGRDAEGNVTYTMSLNDIKKSLTDAPLSGQALYDWAQSNNLSAQQIADATNRSLSSVYADFRAGSKSKATADKKTADDKAIADAANSKMDDSSTGGEAAGGLQQAYAMGGATGYALGGLGTLGGYSDGGRLLKGPGDGVSDSIPATIGRKQQPARLADGEFVVPARIVSELGNGSTDAGAKKLYAMLDRVQRARGKTTGKNKVAANSRADKYLPA
jgi:hypothetical protein